MYLTLDSNSIASCLIHTHSPFIQALSSILQCCLANIHTPMDAKSRPLFPRGVGMWLRLAGMNCTEQVTGRETFDEQKPLTCSAAQLWLVFRDESVESFNSTGSRFVPRASASRMMNVVTLWLSCSAYTRISFSGSLDVDIHTVEEYMLSMLWSVWCSLFVPSVDSAFFEFLHSPHAHHCTSLSLCLFVIFL